MMLRKLGFTSTGLALSVVLSACQRTSVLQQREGEIPRLERPAMSTIVSPASSNGPLSGIFPPNWKVGQEWRVVCRTEVPKPDMPAPDPPPFGEVFFRFRVTEVPGAHHDLYRLEAIREDDQSGYAIYYRPIPFSLAHFDRLERDGWSRGRDNKEKPYVSTEPDRLVLDFPVMPAPDRIYRTTEFTVSHNQYAESFVSTSSGVRVILESDSYRIEFSWNKGEPWWSSVDRTYTPNQPDGGPRIFAGSGRLLR